MNREDLQDQPSLLDGISNLDAVRLEGGGAGGRTEVRNYEGRPLV